MRLQFQKEAPEGRTPLRSYRDTGRRAAWSRQKGENGTQTEKLSQDGVFLFVCHFPLCFLTSMENGRLVENTHELPIAFPPAALLL